MIKKSKISEQEIKKLREKIVELENGWKRTQADLENFRKRSQTEKQELAQFATTDLVMQILPILDNFSRALKHKPKELAGNNYVLGLEYTKNQLEKVLKDNGLEKIAVQIGEKFNPQIHEAILSEKSDQFSPNQIVEVTEKGYKLNGKLIRPVKVKVAK